MKDTLKKILDDKQALRQQLSAKPIAEKLWMLEEMSERGIAVREESAVYIPNEPWTLPQHWKWLKMGDVATIVGGGTPRTDKPQYFNGDIPWITPADLSKYREKTISTGARCITKEGLDNSGARLLPAGTVLFSSRAPIGYVVIATNPVSTNQGFKSFILNDQVTPDYVYYYLQRARGLAIALASGTTFLEISGKKAAQIPIPVPALPEQRRIVAEIEKQFSRLEEGVSALKRVQANLKRYRAALLKAACEGKLVSTEAELQKSGSGVSPLKSRDGSSTLSYESGEQLLKRILDERRKNWQGRGKYKEPASPDTTNLPKLPEGWTWATLDQTCDKITDGEHLSPKIQPSGVFLLSAKDVREAGVQLDDPKHVSSQDAEQFRSRCNPEKGDVLIVSRGATIGRICVVQISEVFCLMGSVILLKPHSPISGKFLSICLSERRAKVILGIISGSTAQQAIYIRDIRPFSIPLPPLAEQKRIVEEVERRLSVVDELESLVTTNLQRASSLRQSILQCAFSGGLV